MRGKYRNKATIKNDFMVFMIICLISVISKYTDNYFPVMRYFMYIIFRVSVLPPEISE